MRGEKQKALLILRRRKYQEQVLLKADLSNLLASKVTNEEEEEVLEEFEQMRREALGLPDVPIHTFPLKEPGVKENQNPVHEQEREQEREAILA